MSDLITYTASAGQPEFTQPTLGLRVYNGRLQQQFTIGTAIDHRGKIIPLRLEWRDVPVVNEPPSQG